MHIEYSNLNEINSSFVVFENVSGVAFEEAVTLNVGGKVKKGQVAMISGERVLIQVFEGTEEFSLGNASAKFLGKPMEIGLSPEVLGRVFDGCARPIDGLPNVYGALKKGINAKAINPVSRVYPRNFIQTGISAIDGLVTLIRGQKLPIFTGNGLPGDQLAAQIISQASLSGADDDNFAIVFAGMGIKHDTAEFFKRKLEEAGVMERVVMFLNLADDAVMERIITPKAALTVAEYLAYDCGMHVLVILTDMTAYAEALREISSAKGEIPGRKGYPGYLYSELASIYERAGIVRDGGGSLTQIPILSMPGDDITHPIPDLTGYITEGQIVLSRGLHGQNVYPPISALASLSRLMKDGIGESYTRADHTELAYQLFSSYARVNEIRALALVIGEDELSDADKNYMRFGRVFEERFLKQNVDENRQMTETLRLGWEVLGELGVCELDRVSGENIRKYYSHIN